MGTLLTYVLEFHSLWGSWILFKTGQGSCPRLRLEQVSFVKILGESSQGENPLNFMIRGVFPGVPSTTAKEVTSRIQDISVWDRPEGMPGAYLCLLSGLRKILTA